jgi:hypothetical protein
MLEPVASTENMDLEKPVKTRGVLRHGRSGVTDAVVKNRVRRPGRSENSEGDRGNYQANIPWILPSAALHSE